MTFAGNPIAVLILCHTIWLPSIKNSLHSCSDLRGVRLHSKIQGNMTLSRDRSNVCRQYPGPASEMANAVGNDGVALLRIGGQRQDTVVP